MIESINLARLINSEHMTLARRILLTVRKHIEALPELVAISTRLEEQINAEAEAFKQTPESTFTSSKQAADQRRDDAARQLYHSIQSFQYAANAAAVEAATLIHEKIKNLPDIVTEAGERETADITNLVARLGEEPYAAALELLSAQWMVDQLAQFNTQYDTISQQQTTADSVRGSGNVSLARKPVDATLRKIFRAIETRFDLETDTPDIRTCLAELNYDISEAATTMKQRLALTKDKTTPDTPSPEPAE